MQQQTKKHPNSNKTANWIYHNRMWIPNSKIKNTLTLTQNRKGEVLFADWLNHVSVWGSKETALEYVRSKKNNIGLNTFF